MLQWPKITAEIGGINEPLRRCYLFRKLFFFALFRFFKIFPLVGLHEIGLEKFARYINAQVKIWKGYKKFYTYKERVILFKRLFR
jgi:hypothetical protein